MDTEPTGKATVEQLRDELELREHRIGERLAALQDEVTSLAPIPKGLFTHPLVKVGGMLLAGLAVGLLFGGRRREKGASAVSASHRALVDHYVEALAAEVRARTDRGASPEAAVREAVGDRAPVVVLEAGDGAERDREDGPGVLRQVLRLSLRYGLPFILEQGMSFLFRGPEHPVEEEAPEGDETGA